MNDTDKLKQAFATALNISEADITDELRYQGIPEWDSVSHMVLISEIEAAFGISLDTDDVIDMSSFGVAREILRKYKVDV